jgi:phosphoglucomutase
MQILEAALKARIEAWTQAPFDADTRAAVAQMLAEAQYDALKEAFYKDLEFGTGGLRGIMGVGTNRMNQYTVGLATQGLANYLRKSFEGSIKVAVAYDSRHRSREFAQIVANVFSANGFQVYLFEELRPTPLLSFAIRHLGCHSGVMLTASHNPKEYNGYKAYWNDGAQLTSPHDKNVMEEVRKVQLEEVNFVANEANIHTLGQEIDEVYLQKLQEILPNKDPQPLKIVFTPLHGTGATLVPKALAASGFAHCHTVAAQAAPDGDFPTVQYPNPEEAEALTLALAEAKNIQADLVLATDPDADRVGIAVRDDQGDFVLLNGNQTATLLFYAALLRQEASGKPADKSYVVKTIVTSELLDALAAHFGVACINTYTGFKYIAAEIRAREATHQYLIGAEESYGYLLGDFVRDKDAVSACVAIAQLAADLKASGSSLFMLLLDIYKRFGYYHESLISITKKGIQGAEEIQKLMQSLRQNPPAQLMGERIVKIKDFQLLEEHDLATQTKEALSFGERSNVLQFFTEEGSKISVRPSGTEPKIKFYIGLRAVLEDVKDFEARSAELQAKAQRIREELGI